MDLDGPGLCLFVLFMVYLGIFGLRRGEKIWGDRAEEAMTLEQADTQAVLTAAYDKKKLIIMFVILALMVISYVFSLLPTHMTALCAAALCIICGCCSTKDVAKELNWQSVIFLASCLGLANAITVSGAGQLISDAIVSVLGTNASPYLVFAVLVTLALFISQFITNSTAIIIVLPVAVSFCTSYGLSPMPFCIGVTLAASVACCTPLAAAQIAMTQVAGYI